MKNFITFATFIPASFLVFVLIEEFFSGTIVNILVFFVLKAFFRTWFKSLKKTETCANK